MEYRSGFVNIIGSPNVGKSTLMNLMTGEPFSIITPKPQTTRHRILGIFNGKNVQIIFSDTPGIIQAKYLLQKSMMISVQKSLKDADILLYVTENTQDFLKNHNILKRLQKIKISLIVVINKIDKIKKENLEKIMIFYKENLPNANILPISALKKLNISILFNTITKLLPIHLPYYPNDILTDRPKRFFVNEIIREKILLFYQKEIPYAVEVVTEEFKEYENIIHIYSTIFVERKSQQIILIGYHGNALKKLGIQSRKCLENFFKKKILLKFHIKINKNWRSKKKELNKLGYLL